MRDNYLFAPVTAPNGDNTLVPALAGHRIRVIACALAHGTTATEVRFESGAGGAALTGSMVFAPGVALVLPFTAVGWFQTATGALLNLEVAGATVAVTGCVVYEYIPDEA